MNGRRLILSSIKMGLLALIFNGITNQAKALESDTKQLTDMSQLSGPCYLSIFSEIKNPPGVKHVTCEEVSKAYGLTYIVPLYTGDASEEISRDWARILKNELEKNPKYHVIRTGSFPNSITGDLSKYAWSMDNDPDFQGEVERLKIRLDVEQRGGASTTTTPSQKICEGINLSANATDAQKYQLFQSIFKDKSVSAECREKLWVSISKSYRDQKEGEYLKAHPEKIQAALNHSCGQMKEEEKSKCEQARYLAWSLSPVAPTKAGATQLVCRIQNGADAVAIDTSLVSTPKCPQLNARAECFYNDAVCDGPEGSTVGLVTCPSINDEGRCPEVSECANFTCPSLTSAGQSTSGQAGIEE